MFLHPVSDVVVEDLTHLVVEMVPGDSQTDRRTVDPG